MRTLLTFIGGAVVGALTVIGVQVLNEDDDTNRLNGKDCVEAYSSDSEDGDDQEDGGGLIVR